MGKNRKRRRLAFLALRKLLAVGRDHTKDAFHDGGFVICRDGLFRRLVTRACKVSARRVIGFNWCTMFLKKNSGPPNIMRYEPCLGHHLWFLYKFQEGHTKIHPPSVRNGLRPCVRVRGRIRS